MRDIGSVMQKIMREVPDDCPDRARFKGALHSVINDAKYAAPELMPQIWGRAANILQRYLGDPNEEWKRRIASIFAGRDSI